jgi:hypothetical protein
MIPIVMIPEIGGRKIKENGEGMKSSYDIFDIR